MNSEDVQPPEFIIDGMRPDGKIQKVPFLYQREGETWDQFCGRMSRVSNSLNSAERGSIPISHLIMMCLVGLLLWWAIWRLVGWAIQ